MTPCESTRGRWSEPGKRPRKCPDCGGPMPVRPLPLRSWMAERQHDVTKVTVAPGTQRALRIKGSYWETFAA